MFVNAAVFCLAFFLDFFEIAFIVFPLIVPVARKLGVDMTWFAVLLAVNLQTSFMHPPFGIALYNLRSVTPQAVRTSQIYWGAVPFLLIQLLVVAILILVPRIASVAATTEVRPDLNVDLPPSIYEDSSGPAYRGSLPDAQTHAP